MTLYNQKYEYNTQAFLNETENSFYLLGAYMADGHINVYESSVSAVLTSKDYDWLVEIGNLLILNFKQNQIKQHENAYRIYVNNKIIVEWLISHNCTPKKSLTLEVPDIPSQYLPDFVRGVIDGDGTVGMYTYNKKFSTGIEKTYFAKTCIIYSSSEKFIDKLNSLLTKAGFKPKKRIDARKTAKIGDRVITRTNPLYNLTFSERNAYDFLKWVYYPGHTISLNRKKETANQIINWYETNTKKPLVRLTEEDVITIIDLLKLDKPIAKIAKMFNVNSGTIYYIKTNKTWRYLPR